MKKKKNKKVKKKLKLNLGCGHTIINKFIGVDKFGKPKQKVDLEVFPWPWKDNSVDEIIMNHILEHLGATTDCFFNIMQEIYRICCHNAIIHIKVPDPRSDSFLGDPTHVRPITRNILDLFSKERNNMFIKDKWSSTTLAIFLNIDLKIVNYKIHLMPYWQEKYTSQSISREDMDFAILHYNNVINELEFKLKVQKDAK